MRTSFHHQPEAQHPNFPLSTSWQADYPIFTSNCYRIDAAPRTDTMCHVWTAPSWQGFSSRLQAGQCSHVFGLLVRFT